MHWGFKKTEGYKENERSFAIFKLPFLKQRQWEIFIQLVIHCSHKESEKCQWICSRKSFFSLHFHLWIFFFFWQVFSILNYIIKYLYSTTLGLYLLFSCRTLVVLWVVLWVVNDKKKFSWLATVNSTYKKCIYLRKVLKWFSVVKEQTLIYI